jgi:hypothetical protein
MAFLNEQALVEGRLFTYCDDPDTHKPVRFRLRSVPESEEREILRRHKLMNLKIVGNRHDVDLAKTLAARIDYAVAAWLDTEGFSVRVDSVEAAAQYGSAIGQVVTPGEVMKWDGRWTPEAKRLVLALDTRLSGWIEKKARAVFGEVVEEEAALQGE